MELYRTSTGIELRSRNVPQLAVQGTYGSLSFSLRGHDEEGIWPLGPGDIGVRAGLVVHTDVRPLKPSDDWTDGYLIKSSISLGPGGAPVYLHHLRPLAADQLSDGAGGITPRHVFRNGWQSWSGTGSFRHNDIDREPPLTFLRNMSVNPSNPAPRRPGEFVSEMATVIKPERGRGAILVGFVDTAEHFSHICVRFEHGRAKLACQIELDGRLLEPGRAIQMPTLLVAFGQDENELLEGYARMLGNRMNARVPSRHFSGWCSWYHYYTGVTESDILSNLDEAASNPENYPFDIFQIDDGFQPTIGEWLETNPKFPNGLPYLAKCIRERGFTPGVWTAPFLVSPVSRVYREHPDWVLRDNFGRPVNACWNPGWNPRTNYALDATNPAVQEHLRHLFKTLAQTWGFRYIKIDFLYAAALKARLHNPHFTRAGALRLGLEAIREGCGDDTFILGCGCPLGPAVGMVDGMRIGTDVAPYWSDWKSRLLGHNLHLLSTGNAVRNILTRAFMHRRLWLNDPDCVMLKSEGTKLTEEETRTLAGTVAVLGGMAIISDDLKRLDPERAGLFARLVDIMRDQPAGPADGAGTPRVIDLMLHEFPEIMVRRGIRNDYIALINAKEAAQSMAVNLQEALGGRQSFPAGLSEFWTGEYVHLRGTTVEITVPPHGTRMFVVEKQAAV